MKTFKFLKIKKVSILTLVGIVAMSLTACDKRVAFNKTTFQSLAGPDDPAPDLPPAIQDPLPPGENDGGPVVEPPIVVTPPVVPPIDSNVEIFQQVATGGKVDILFIIDNSPSMDKEQKKLSEKLKAFIPGIKNLDWQMGFTTTDVSNGKYGLKGSLLELAGHPGKTVLDNSYADADQVFLKTVRRPEMNGCFIGCPSSDEQPLKASILSMQKHLTENANFYRSDADLVIIVLSDEDELSTGPSKATKPQAVVDSFHAIFGFEKQLSVYGIIIEPGDQACYDDQKSANFQDAWFGTHVKELARITKGFTGSICADDYTTHLQNISNSVRLLSDFFVLKKSPAPGTVSVQLSPVQNIRWKIEDNKLMFETAPVEGTVIQVTYK